MIPDWTLAIILFWLAIPTKDKIMHIVESRMKKIINETPFLSASSAVVQVSKLQQGS